MFDKSVNAINHGLLLSSKLAQTVSAHLTETQPPGKPEGIHVFASYIGILIQSPQMEQELALRLGLGSPKSLSSAAQWLKEQIVCESLRMPRRNTLLDRL